MKAAIDSTGQAYLKISMPTEQTLKKLVGMLNWLFRGKWPVARFLDDPDRNGGVPVAERNHLATEADHAALAALGIEPVQG